MTILWRFGPPLQWNVVVVDGGVGHKYVVQPWYQFLADNNFSHGEKCPSITGALTKNGKLSSAGERIGTTRFRLCAFIFVPFCVL